MAAPKFDVPVLKGEIDIPRLREGAMAGIKSFEAAEKIQGELGFPGKLVDNWHDVAIAKMGDLLDKYRGFRVFMDACVHCGACSKCRERRDALRRAGVVDRARYAATAATT